MPPVILILGSRVTPMAKRDPAERHNQVTDWAAED
jgi:hypothetical protein